MDRVKIKEKAKEMIKGNKWYLWKPVVLLCCLYLVVGVITGALVLINKHVGITVGSIINAILSIASSAFAIWYAHYVLSFVRDKKIETIDYKEIIEFVKKHWLKALIVSVIVGFNVMFGTILLIVPGIIASIGLVFYQLVQADNLDMNWKDILKKSWEITNGHKMDLFVMTLSFIGWEIVATLTLGILYIWLVPYVIVAFALAYESLKGTTKK